MTREIRVERAPNVNPQLVFAVLSGVHSLLNDVGLVGFKTIGVDIDAATSMRVKKATLPNGKLNVDELFKLLRDASSRDPLNGGKPHADIVLTDRVFDKFAKSWGASNFLDGSMVLSMSGYRPDAIELWKFFCIPHETCHLVGLFTHPHEHYKIDDYVEVAHCLSDGDFKSQVICDACKDALTSFWQGVEKKTGSQYLRRE